MGDKLKVGEKEPNPDSLQNCGTSTIQYYKDWQELIICQKDGIIGSKWLSDDNIQASIHFSLNLAKNKPTLSACYDN